MEHWSLDHVSDDPSLIIPQADVQGGNGDSPHPADTGKTPSPSPKPDCSRIKFPTRRYQVDIRQTKTLDNGSRERRDDNEDHRGEIGEKEVGCLISWYDSEPLPSLCFGFSGSMLVSFLLEVRGQLFESFIGDNDDWAGGKVGHLD